MEERRYSKGLRISDILKDTMEEKMFTLQPRFTIVHHPIREKFGLSITTYTVIDSINQLSHRPDHPWCVTSKDQMADFLVISRRSVFNSIAEGLEKGLIEKNERGDLRSTRKWVDQVTLYQSRMKGGDMRE